MLEALKFVQRGVARRDFVPGLMHFRIKDGRCTGFNGVTSLSAPIDVSFDVAPLAGLFIKALDACEEVVTLKMDTPSSLLVRSGAFKIAVPCVPVETVPETKPEGTLLAPHESILGAFEALAPFIGVDASRRWAMGILLAGGSAFATNNVILTEYWLGSVFPQLVNVPSGVVEEVLRIGEEMTGFQISENSITFHYSDGRWVKSALLALEWPDVPSVLRRCWQDTKLTLVSPALRDACQKLAAFGDKDYGHIYFRGTDISTTKGGIAEGGAVFELPCLPVAGCYHASHLNKTLAAAEAADFTRYPDAIPFAGGKLRGAMLGVVT